MAYVALKPCCFAGQRFKIGENIPEDLILPGSAKNLVKMQVIANAEQTGTIVTPAPAAPVAEDIPLVIHAKEGDLELHPTREGLQEVFDALTGTAQDAETIIANMVDEDALILLHCADSRKAVMAAAETRGKELSVPDGAGEA